MVPGRMRSIQLPVERMGQPGKRVPVAGCGRGEGPVHRRHPEPGLHRRVLRDIIGVVEIDEAATGRPGKKEQRADKQSQTNQYGVSPRRRVAGGCRWGHRRRANVNASLRPATANHPPPEGIQACLGQPLLHRSWPLLSRSSARPGCPITGRDSSGPKFGMVSRWIGHKRWDHACPTVDFPQAGWGRPRPVARAAAAGSGARVLLAGPPRRPIV